MWGRPADELKRGEPLFNLENDFQEGGLLPREEEVQRLLTKTAHI